MGISCQEKYQDFICLPWQFYLLKKGKKVAVRERTCEHYIRISRNLCPPFYGKEVSSWINVHINEYGPYKATIAERLQKVLG